MVSSLRRLAADHAALHNSELPPNYLFPADETSADDLTQLAILLTGPQGTPYSQGLWRLQLKMPEDYPKSPPKASFKTRIWHPNVEELTGAVCVDTLKRDWKPSLTLRDVLVTISCLLIYPNPDSALNSAAGAMLQEDYDAFARQARLMTSIHAPVPTELKDAVMEAKLRGEDAGTVVKEQEIADSRSVRSRTETRVSSLTMKASRSNNKGRADSQSQSQHDGHMQQEHHGHDHNTITELSDSEEEINDENENMSGASKENNPSLSPSPVKFASLSPRKYPHGKRPLSVLEMPFPTDSDIPMLDTDNTDQQGMTASEKNIAANTNADPTTARDPILLPQRKSPKLTNSMLFSSHHTATIASSSRAGADIGIYEDTPLSDTHSSLHYWSTRGNSNGRRNSSSTSKGYNHPMNMPIPVLRSQSGHDISLSSTGSGSDSSIPISAALPSSSRVSSSSSNSKLISASRKMMMPSMTAFSTSSTSSANSKRTKPRIGIRRL
ncbi:hypothetical protein MAP00_000276 [Monascus purpureus]|nr:hypothetical protein MAP00_000276 [Monascus purpureus]